MVDGLRRHTPGVHPVEWLGSGNLVIRRSAFEAMGGFDTTLETCEDVDLCQRLIARGGRIVSVEGMVSVHHGDPRTLRAVFLGELWRGRDNLRVSLRVPLTRRSAPGVLMPVLTLGALLAAPAGLVWLVRGHPLVTLGAIAAVIALAIPGAVLLVLRAPSVERGPAYAGRALAFSLVYNLGRALALVARAGHRTRRADRR
jgi:hypothetical protein